MKPAYAESAVGAQQVRQVTRAETYVATLGLIAEFADLPAGAVKSCAARAREELLRAGVRDELPVAVEAMTRQRLRELAVVRTG